MDTDVRVSVSIANKMLRGITSRELAHALNALTRGTNWLGCTKDHMLTSISHNDHKVYDQIINKHTTFVTWVEHVWESVKEKRQKKIKVKSDMEQHKVKIRLERSRIKSICDRLATCTVTNCAIKLSKDDQLFFFNRINNIVDFYYHHNLR